MYTPKKANGYAVEMKPFNLSARDSGAFIGSITCNLCQHIQLSFWHYSFKFHESATNHLSNHEIPSLLMEFKVSITVPAIGTYPEPEISNPQSKERTVYLLVILITI
jgi:hypothetical protein